MADGEVVQPGDLGACLASGQALVLVQQPRPFQVVPRLDMGAGIARGGSPVLGEEFPECARRRVEQVAAEQRDQRVGVPGVVWVARGFIERQHGLQQVHVRVLLPWTVLIRQHVVVAAGRVGHVRGDPVQGAAGAGQRLLRPGQPGVPGQGEQHEGQVI